MLLSKDSFIAKIDGVYNGIVVESNFCKKSCFVGEGAGAHPTATSVLSDIISLSKKRKNGFKKVLSFHIKKLVYNQDLVVIILDSRHMTNLVSFRV